jgi:hypothetical protein
MPSCRQQLRISPAFFPLLPEWLKENLHGYTESFIACV